MEVSVNMDELKIIIRKVEKSDTPHLEKICQEGFPKDEAYEIVKSLLDIEHFYVAKDEDKDEVIGFIAIGIYSIRISHIMILAVHPSKQNKGVGTKLLNFVIELLIENLVKKVRLEVRTTNKAAIQFYQKNNFRIIERLEKYYDDSSDGYLMVRDL